MTEATVPEAALPSSSSRQGFDPLEAQDLLSYATLPIVYEELLLAGKTAEEARNEVAGRVPDGVESKVIRHQNSTAVVTYDAARDLVRVMYDGTTEPADVKDNSRFWPEAHPLGGKVYHSYYAAILKEDSEGQLLVDAVRDQVVAFAGRNNKPTAVELTGFSRGGSMSEATAAQWLAEGFADGLNGIKMSSVYTFAAPAVGNAEFCRAFDAAGQKGDIRTVRVVAGDDPVPHILTENAPWYMPGLYTQTGEAYYIGADKQGNMRLLQDPDKAAIGSFRSTSADAAWHDPDVYMNAIKDYAAAGADVILTAQPEAAAKNPAPPHRVSVLSAKPDK